MHLMGKILAGFVLLTAVFAAIYTSKAIVVRNSFTAKAVAYKKKYREDLQPKIEKLQTEIAQKANELERSYELWGRVWSDVQTDITNPNEGNLNIAIGTESGVTQGLVLYGFEVGETGQSMYRGSFLAADVGNGYTALKPNWRLRAGEAREWQSGKWRWRNTIPSGYQENFDKLMASILRSEETMADRQRTLNTQQVLLEQANETLKLREAELVGGDKLSKSDSVDSEFREGLVAAVELTEEERNQILLRIDELRRKVRDVQREIERLNAENTDLVQKLPSTGREEKISRKEN